MKPPPYPGDVRAKGWRLELDHERIRQSDTWALASSDQRPWLLMLLMVAWEQTPCGSLPADDELIAARLAMSPELFTSWRPKLLRGWWGADDGRLYHPVMTECVQEMTQRRGKESARKAAARGAAPTRPASAAPQVQADSHICPTGQRADNRETGAEIHPESDTGTGTGTSISRKTHTGKSDPTVCVSAVDKQRREAAAAALRLGGIAAVDEATPQLAALVELGVTAEQFTAAARIAASAGKGQAYALGVVKQQLQDAAALTRAVPTSEQGPWDGTRAGIEAEGVRLGIGRWSDALDRNGRVELYSAYTARVRAARGGLEPQA